MPHASPPPTSSDRALARALVAWGRAEDAATRDRFAPEWRDRLEAARATVEAEPEAARAALRRTLAAEARPDPARIHPSWFVRALEGESPAVRRAVRALAPDAVRAALGEARAQGQGEAPAGYPPALVRALSLWSERLVGGEDIGPDDPPVVALLAGSPRGELARRIAALGLAKLAYDPAIASVADPDDLSAADRARYDRARGLWDEPDPTLARVARRDLGTLSGPREERPYRLGLSTVGRLLAAVEPFRARWARQHLPYPVARFLRASFSLDHPLVAPAALLAWEGRVREIGGKLLRDGGPG